MSDDEYSIKNMKNRQGSIKDRMGNAFMKRMEGIVSSKITIKNTPKKKKESKWGKIDTSDAFIPPTPSFFPKRRSNDQNYGESNNYPINNTVMFPQINIPEYLKSGVECPYCKYCKTKK